MSALYETWLYVFLIAAAFIIACVVCAAAYANRPSADLRDDWWRDQ